VASTIPWTSIEIAIAARRSGFLDVHDFLTTSDALLGDQDGVIGHETIVLLNGVLDGFLRFGLDFPYLVEGGHKVDVERLQLCCGQPGLQYFFM